MIIFCWTPDEYSGSVLDEYLIRLVIDEELDNYNDKYEYNFDEIAVNRKYYKPCGY